MLNNLFIYFYFSRWRQTSVVHGLSWTTVLSPTRSVVTKAIPSKASGYLESRCHLTFCSFSNYSFQWIPSGRPRRTDEQFMGTICTQTSWKVKWKYQPNNIWSIKIPAPVRSKIKKWYMWTYKNLEWRQPRKYVWKGGEMRRLCL